MSLKISNLSKKHGDIWILRDVSFEVERGEIFGLLGESAAKSAVLRLIYGSEKPDSGGIFFDNRDLTESAAKERSFVLLPNAERGFLKNIFKSRNIKDLSDSKQQELVIECALENKEKVLLLDNPFSAMDLEQRDEIYENLRQAAKEKNLAIVVATNDSEEAFALCNRVGVLHGGEVIQTGTPREIYETPNSLAAARALGRNNLIRAQRASFNNHQTQEFQTIMGEHRLRTDNTDKNLLGAINSPVALAIRPEHISISFGASFPEDNLLKAKIVGVQYLGATTRVSLDANGLPLEALVLRLVGLNVGDECLVGLPPDRILVLKD